MPGFARTGGRAVRFALPRPIRRMIGAFVVATRLGAAANANA